jgi:hypothetical protein
MALFPSSPFRVSWCPRWIRAWAVAAWAVSVAAAAQAAPLPHEANLEYKVVWGVVSLDAEQQWRLEGSRYTLTTVIHLPMAFKDRRYVSTGHVGAEGLVPDRYEDYQVGDPQPRTIAAFERDQGLLRYGRPSKKLRTLPLPEGIQDINALTFQLMWLGASGAGQTIPVTNGKGIVMHRFVDLGPSQAVLDGKTLPTIHLGSQSKEGSIEVLMAPSLGNLPLTVIRSMDGQTLKLQATKVDLKAG